MGEKDEIALLMPICSIVLFDRGGCLSQMDLIILCEVLPFDRGFARNKPILFQLTTSLALF